MAVLVVYHLNVIDIIDINFRNVCGQVWGYQYGISEAFAGYILFPTKTIDDRYGDMISITYGSSPRKHIWTYNVVVM